MWQQARTQKSTDPQPPSSLQDNKEPAHTPTLLPIEEFMEMSKKLPPLTACQNRFMKEFKNSQSPRLTPEALQQYTDFSPTEWMQALIDKRGGPWAVGNLLNIAVSMICFGMPEELAINLITHSIEYAKKQIEIGGTPQAYFWEKFAKTLFGLIFQEFIHQIALATDKYTFYSHILSKLKWADVTLPVLELCFRNTRERPQGATLPAAFLRQFIEDPLCGNIRQGLIILLILREKDFFKQSPYAETLLWNLVDRTVAIESTQLRAPRRSQTITQKGKQNVYEAKSLIQKLRPENSNPSQPSGLSEAVRTSESPSVLTLERASSASTSSSTKRPASAPSADLTSETASVGSTEEVEAGNHEMIYPPFYPAPSPPGPYMPISLPHPMPFAHWPMGTAIPWEQTQVTTLQQQLAKAQQQLSDEREQAFTKRETELTRREQESAKRLMEVERREQLVTVKEKTLLDTQTELLQRRAAITAAEIQLQKQQTELQSQRQQATLEFRQQQAELKSQEQAAASRLRQQQAALQSQQHTQQQPVSTPALFQPAQPQPAQPLLQQRFGYYYPSDPSRLYIIPQ